MNDYLVKKLQGQLSAIQKEMKHYTKMLSNARSEDAAIIYDGEMKYWRGQAEATGAAIAMIQDAEVTGGTPF